MLVTKEVTKLAMYTLTESEELIMNLLWERKSLSIMQIVNALDEEKHWSKHAIISFLKRMEQKGMVSYTIEGRTKHYFAVVKRDEMIRQETKGVLDRFFEGKWGAMVSHMIKEDCSPDDIQELWELLQELKEKEDGKHS